VGEAIEYLHYIRYSNDISWRKNTFFQSSGIMPRTLLASAHRLLTKWGLSRPSFSSSSSPNQLPAVASVSAENDDCEVEGVERQENDRPMNRRRVWRRSAPRKAPPAIALNLKLSLSDWSGLVQSLSRLPWIPSIFRPFLARLDPVHGRVMPLPPRSEQPGFLVLPAAPASFLLPSASLSPIENSLDSDKLIVMQAELPSPPPSSPVSGAVKALQAAGLSIDFSRIQAVDEVTLKDLPDLPNQQDWSPSHAFMQHFSASSLHSSPFLIDQKRLMSILKWRRRRMRGHKYKKRCKANRHKGKV
jgi:hypothetical protein